MPPKRNGDGSRRPLHTARGCTYKEFLNCQPLNFKETKEAIGLAHWTVGHEVANEMTWKSLMKMMIEDYCPRSELALLCSRMVPKESDKVEKYVGGLPDNIQGNLMSARPKMIQEAIELENNLMDQKVRAYAARQDNNKRRMDNNPNNNHVQQPPYKRQNVARAYTAKPSKEKEYARTLPLCNKWLYHNRPCTVKNGEACGRVYALGGGEADQDPNNITDDIDA
uniref:Retrotransposon gag domain-containing protein n=1 Tax=Tanacetum cinerariifolium TaxID=118510 RepID=A0A699JKE3_TANCI|nr:hypothetical protein [Tanacetum cinerariifolium]